MRKTIDLDKLSEVTITMINTLRMMDEIQNKLYSDIDKISECYKGKDAEILRYKYKISVKNVDFLKGTLDSYIKYFKWLIESYGENLNNAIKNYTSLADNMLLFDKRKEESDITNLLFDKIDI